MKNSNALPGLSLALGSFLGLSILGCSHSLNPAVKQAEYSFQGLEKDPQVQQHASMELREASQLLKRAKDASTEGEAVHLAYLTERKIQTAQFSADQRVIEEKIRELHSESGERRARMHEESAVQARRQVVELQSEVSSLQSALREFETRQTERGFEVTLGDVVFETDRANLKSGAEQRLRPLAQHLRENPDRVAQIEGHTDNVGSASYNLQLSDRRAHSVKDALLSMGVSRQQLVARGFGEKQPVIGNTTPEGRLQNRRVEIIIAPSVQQGFDPGIDRRN
jgi:OOP family OmpA-OmpF porin